MVCVEGMLLNTPIEIAPLTRAQAPMEPDIVGAEYYEALLGTV